MMGLGALLFGFQGRIRRTTYWLASIGTSVAVGVVASVVFAVAIGMAASGTAADGTVSAAGSTAAGMVMLWLAPLYIAAIWIGIALGVKRCHDRNYPGVMILICLVPFLGWLWALIDLGFIDGTPGPNQFGPSPKALTTAPVVTGAVA